ncbi:hypothetical protein AVEN_262278-1, partial [Araneus ventricosus]
MVCVSLGVSGKSWYADNRTQMLYVRKIMVCVSRGVRKIMVCVSRGVRKIMVCVSRGVRKIM